MVPQRPLPGGVQRTSERGFLSKAVLGVPLIIALDRPGWLIQPAEFKLLSHLASLDRKPAREIEIAAGFHRSLERSCNPPPVHRQGTCPCQLN